MSRVPRTALVLALLVQACAVNVRLDAGDLDGLLEEMGAESVVRREAYTLWSPFPPEGTALWREALDEELPAQRALFGVDQLTRRVQVVLEAVPELALRLEQGPDGQVTVRRPAGPDPTRGLHGYAHEGGVHVHVPATGWLTTPEGRRIPSITRPIGTLRRTLRHELAHWFAFHEGIEGDKWLDEGLAQCVSGLGMEDGRLLDRGVPKSDLDRARALPVEELSLAELLDWTEDLQPILEAVRDRDPDRELGLDPVPRVTCGLYVRFLLGLDGSGAPVEGLAERLRELQCMPRDVHLAGEARWRAWLADRLAREASATCTVAPR